jgi:hypothetical protein
MLQDNKSGYMGIFIRKRIYKYIGNMGIDNNKKKGENAEKKLQQ